MKRMLRGALLLAMLVGFVPAQAVTFRDAMQAFESGDYATARAAFLSLAELGDGASQFNLGAMHLQGQGGPSDKGTGVGWLLAATGNGYPAMEADKLERIRAGLTPEELESAQAVLDRYGREALMESVLPFTAIECCPRDTRPSVVEFSRGRSPTARWRQDGIVLIAGAVGTDGLAYDPEIIAAVPEGDFELAATDVLLKSRFKPATRDGEAVPGYYAFTVVYSNGESGRLWDMRALENVMSAAELGEPNAQYLVAAISVLDRSIGIDARDARAMMLSSAQAGHAAAQYSVAAGFAGPTDCDGDDKFAVWLRRSAAGGYGPSEVVLAYELLAESPTAEAIAEAKQLLLLASESDDVYPRKHAAFVLAASPIEAVRDPAAAARAASKLRARSPDPQYHEAIAIAAAANGDFKEAVDRQERALDLARDLYWNTSKIEERLAAFRAGTMWYGSVLELPPALTPPPPVRFPLQRCEGDECKRSPDKPQAPTGSRIPR